MINHLSTAQYKKGSKFWLAEGTFNGSMYSDSQKSNVYSFTNDNQDSNHDITLTFKKASFTENNLAKGWLISYNVVSNKQSRTTTSAKYTYLDNYNHVFDGGYFINKFFPLTKSLAIYGELLGKIGFSFNNGKGVSPAHDIHIGANANLGIRYFINKKIFVNGEASLANVNLQSLTVVDKTSAKVDISSIMTINTVSIAIGKSL